MKYTNLTSVKIEDISKKSVPSIAKALNKLYADFEIKTNLDVMYAKGRGVAQNYAQAVYWFKKSAKQGVALAQYILGVMYYNGLGVARSYVHAYYWYNKSAGQGHAKAQDILNKWCPTASYKKEISKG